MITDYIKSFDHVRGCWAKKQEAAAFGDYLSHELGLNRKGIVVEPDGRTYRIRIPLISVYWHPITPERWEEEFNTIRKEVKRWASA